MFLARQGVAALIHLLSLLNTAAVCIYTQTVDMCLHQACTMINCYTYYHGPKLSFLEPELNHFAGTLRGWAGSLVQTKYAQFCIFTLFSWQSPYFSPSSRRGLYQR